MRFFVTSEWKKNPMLRMVLAFFLVYVAFFWATNWAVWLTRMDLTPDSVAMYYRGDAASEFGQPPRPVGSLAEQSHFHLFAMGILVMTLSHLLLFLPMSMRVKGTLVGATFGSAFVVEACSWLIRFVSPLFAWLKIASFLILQVALLGLIVALLLAVVRPGRNAYRDSETHA